MKKTSRIAALLLLVTLGFTFPGAPAFALPLPLAHHPAVCHHHMPSAPSPAPVSHQCCVAGPESAMPVAAFSQQLSAAQFCAVHNGQQISLIFLPVSMAVSLAVSPGTAPSAAPMRI